MTSQRRGRLVFDADCGFCTSSARWLEARGCEVVPWQSLDLARHGLSVEQVTTTAWWLHHGVPTAYGAGAIARALGSCSSGWPFAGRILQLPGVRGLAGFCYRWIARNRYRLPGGGATCRVADVPARESGTRT